MKNPMATITTTQNPRPKLRPTIVGLTPIAAEASGAASNDSAEGYVELDVEKVVEKVCVGSIEPYYKKMFKQCIAQRNGKTLQRLQLLA